MKHLNFARICAAAGIVMLLVLLRPPSTADAQTVRWQYEQSPCLFAVPAGYTVDCGTLIVPQDHFAQQESRPLALQVAYFHSTNPTPPADPILYLVGGPGVSLLYDFEATFYHFEALIHHRDVIVYEQRGTGFSTPALRCEPPPDGVSFAAGIADCGDYFRQWGFDLEHFSSVQSAADAETLRQALNIPQWNVVSVSYGSRLAQVIARDYPQTVRSMILDSVVAIGDMNGVGAGNTTSWIQQIITDCGRDAACNAVYPDLAEEYATVVRSLGRSTSVTTSDGESMVIDGNSFGGTLRNIASNTAGAWQVPAIIHAAAAGDFDAVLSYDPGYTLFDAMNTAMNCNDVVQRVSPSGCERLGIEPGPGLSLGTDGIGVPTLIINGRYDSITPTDIARVVHADLPGSYFFEFPYLGHGVVRSAEPCAKAVAFAFLDQPTVPPPAACIADTTPQFNTQNAAIILG